MKSLLYDRLNFSINRWVIALKHSTVNMSQGWIMLQAQKVIVISVCSDILTLTITSRLNETVSTLDNNKLLILKIPSTNLNFLQIYLTNACAFNNLHIFQSRS